MYLPSHFEITDKNELIRIMSEHPLGIIVTNDKGLDANHIPFIFDSSQGEMGSLIAHVARSNPLWQEMSESEVMVIFRGVESYISPNWYPSKHETHRQVPTWNYEVVHVHGRLTIHDDDKFVRGAVGKLTKIHESTEIKPWKMSDAPQDYMETMIKAVVGIKVTITSMVGKGKLSQNREIKDRHGAINALENKGNLEMALAIKKQL